MKIKVAASLCEVSVKSRGRKPGLSYSFFAVMGRGTARPNSPEISWKSKSYWKKPGSHSDSRSPAFPGQWAYALSVKRLLNTLPLIRKTSGSSPSRLAPTKPTERTEYGRIKWDWFHTLSKRFNKGWQTLLVQHKHSIH